MEGDHDKLREIRDAEQWLGGQLSGDDPVSDAERAEQVKLTTRVALGEQWLVQQLTDETPPELAAKLKAAVRETIAETASPELVADRRRRMWVIRLYAVGSLAAAAAVVFFVSMYRPAAELESVTEDYSLLDDFEQFGDGKLLSSLDDLAAEISALELALGDASSSFGFQTPIDELELFDDFGDGLDGLNGESAPS